MTLAFHASDRGSNPSLAIIFFLLLLYSVCGCCFYFDLFFLFFLSLTVSTIRRLLHLGIKSHKAVDILYCVQKFSLFCVHTHHACITAIFDPTNEVFYVAKHAYRVYITFIIICFSNCLKLLHLSHTKTNC